MPGRSTRHPGRGAGPERERQTDKRFLLRLDPDLYEALAHWAADELRSVNAQIEYLLRDALRRAGRESRANRG